MRFNTILIAGFLGLTILVGISGHFSTVFSQETLQDFIGENSVSLAVEILDEIDREIYNRIEEFQVYSVDKLLQDTVIQSNQEFDNLDNIQDYIDEKDNEWITAPKDNITLFMQALINNDLSKCLKDRIEFYEDKHSYERYGEIFVTNKYGANIAQTGKTSDYYQADEAWWQNAKEDGSYITDIEYDESANVYSTDICIKIDDKDGDFLGILKAVLNYQEVINILKEFEGESNKIPGQEEHQSMVLTLLNNNGETIYSTEEYEIFSNQSKNLPSNFLDSQQNTGYKYYFTAEGEMPSEKEKLFAHINSQGYKEFEGFGWILIIEYDTEEIFAPIAQMRNSVLIMSIVLLFAAVILSILISRIISKPIKKITNAIDKVSKGRLDVRLEKSNIYEINKLAESLDRVMTSMKRAIKRLKIES